MADNIFFDLDPPKEQKKGQGNVFFDLDPVKEEMTAGEVTADVANQAAYGFNQGVADVLTLPSRVRDTLTKPLDPLVESFDKTVFGEGETYEMVKGVRDYVKSLPYDNVLINFLEKGKRNKPKTMAGRVANTTGKLVSTDLPLAAATLGTAPAVSTATRGATSLGGQILNNMARSIQAAPGRAAAGELAASTGAGIGVGLARENDAGPTGEFLGGLAGAMTPTLAANSLTGLAVKGANKIAKRLSPEGMKKAAEAEISASLQKATKEIDPTEIARTKEIEKDVPGLKLTLAEKSGNERLIDAQKELDTLPDEIAKNEIERRASNEAAIKEAERNLSPQATFDPDRLVSLSDEKIKSSKKSIQDQLKGLDREESDIAQQLSSQRNSARSYGENLREAIKQKRSAKKQEMSALADQYGLNSDNAYIDFKDVSQAMKKSYDESSSLRVNLKQESNLNENEQLIQSVFGGAPQKPKVKKKHVGKSHPIIDVLERLDDRQSISGITQLRSEISEELEILLRNATPGNASQRRGLSAALKTLDNYIDDGLAKAIPDENIAENYLKFRQAYKEDYINNFESGNIYKTLRKDGRRNYRLRDEEVASSFFTTGDEQSILQFNRVFDNDPVARNALQAAILDDLSGKIGTRGTLSEAVFDAWKRRNNSVLRHVPDIEASVDNYGSAIKAIGERRQQLIDRRDALQKNILSRSVDAYTQGRMQAEEFIGKAISNKMLMKRFKGTLDTNEAEESLAKAVWNNILKQNAPIDYLNQNIASIRQGMDPKYIQRIKNLVGAMEKVRLVPAPKRGRISSQPVLQKIEEVLNTGLNQMSSRYFSTVSGRTSERQVGSELFGRFYRGYSKRQADKIMMEALLDPELTQRLIANVGDMKSIPKAKRLYTYLFAIGLTPDDEPETQN